MICRTCGNQNAYVVRTVFQESELLDFCDSCSRISVSWDPDVYLPKIGHKFENLCDKMGNPIEIRSKRHKAEIMREQNVSEAGDRIHGAPIEPKSWTESTRDYRKRNFSTDRPKIREIYQRYLKNARG